MASIKGRTCKLLVLVILGFSKDCFPSPLLPFLWRMAKGLHAMLDEDETALTPGGLLGSIFAGYVPLASQSP